MNAQTDEQLVTLARAAGFHVAFSARGVALGGGTLKSIGALLGRREIIEVGPDVAEYNRLLIAARRLGFHASDRALPWSACEVWTDDLRPIRLSAMCAGLWRVQLCKTDGSTPMGESLDVWLRPSPEALARASSPAHRPALVQHLACRAHPGHESLSWAWVPDLLCSEACDFEAGDLPALGAVLHV